MIGLALGDYLSHLLVIPFLIAGAVLCPAFIIKSQGIKLRLVWASLGTIFLSLGTACIFFLIQSDLTELQPKSIQDVYFDYLVIWLCFLILFLIHRSKKEPLRNLYIYYVIAIPTVLFITTAFSFKDVQNALSFRSIELRLAVNPRELERYRSDPWLYYLDRGEIGQAIQEVKKSIKKEHTCQSYLNLSKLLERQGKADEAKAILEKSLEEAPADPNYYQCYGNLSEFYEKNGDVEGAEALLVDSAKKAGRKESYTQLIAFYEKHDELSKTNSIYKELWTSPVYTSELSDLCKLSEEAASFYARHKMLNECREAIAHCGYSPSRTELFEKYGMPDQAEKALREGYEKDKGNGPAAIDLTAFLLKGKKIEEAKKISNEFILLNPNAAWVRDKLQSMMKENEMNAP